MHTTQKHADLFADKNDAVNAAHRLAHEIELPAYAIEGKYGWSVSERKPSIRFGKVYECRDDGSVCYG